MISLISFWEFLVDFQPASIFKSEQAKLTVGSTQDVSITLPNVEVRLFDLL